MRVRIDAPGGLDHGRRKPRSGMHRKVKGDQIRVAYSVQSEFFHGEVGAGDLVSVGAQARRRGSQPERLSAKLVGGHKQYTHDFFGL